MLTYAFARRVIAYQIQHGTIGDGISNGLTAYPIAQIHNIGMITPAGVQGAAPLGKISWRSKTQF